MKNKIRDLFKVKLNTIRSETEKEREREIEITCLSEITIKYQNLIESESPVVWWYKVIIKGDSKKRQIS